MISVRRTTTTLVSATGAGRRCLSHDRPQTFIGVMFVPHPAKSGKIAPRRANRALGHDLLKGRREAV